MLSQARPDPSVGLTLTEIVKSYGNTRALRGVSLEFRPGEVHTILGENGSGKSTLVKILSGTVVNDSGTITRGEQPVDCSSPASSLRSGIATAFQELTVLPSLTVAENIFLDRYPHNRIGTINRRALESRTAQFLEAHGFELPPKASCRDLTLAQLQLVEVARAIARQPSTLILDEATSALDSPEARQVMKVCRGLAAAGTAVLFVSHRLDEVLEISDRVSTLIDGRIGSTRDAKGITHDILLDELLGKRKIIDLVPDTGDAVSARPRRTVSSTVRARFSIPASAGFREDIAFDLHEGEILGLAGLQGHGQKQVLRIIGGDLPARGAAREIDGEAVNARSPRDTISNGIYYIPEERKVEGIVSGHAIAANMVLSCLPRLSRYGWLMRSVERRFSNDMAIRLGVRLHSLRDSIDSLSGGNQQKVILGRGLLSRPKVLLLDDSMRGIDVRSKDEIYRLLEELTDSGLSVIVNSTEIPELIALCPRVLVFHDHAVSAELVGSDVSEANILRGIFGRSAEKAA